jgi:hypothetical protein
MASSRAALLALHETTMSTVAENFKHIPMKEHRKV